MPRGYANITWLVATDAGRFLLKMPPRGAPRVERTVRVTAAAQAAGVPTPRVVRHDSSGIDLPPFWIQEYIEDAEDAERLWPSLDADERDSLGRELGTVVATLHRTSYRDNVRPLPEVVRGRFDGVITRAREVGELDERTAQRIARVVSERVPMLAAVERRLCHTDLYLENVLLKRVNGRQRFASLLDFEHGLGTDPAEDFVKLAWWNFETHPELRAPFFAGYGDPTRHGADFESRRELFCLYYIVASLGYFSARGLVQDPVRPWMRADDARELQFARDRLQRWAGGGAAC